MTEKPTSSREIDGVDLSVCIGHRSWSFYYRPDGELRPLFARTLPRLAAVLGDLVPRSEIIVADWPDAERPELGLETWLDAVAEVSTPEIRVVVGSGEFTRGGSKNFAALYARAPILFFLDAEMYVTPRLVREGLDVARDGKALFCHFSREQFDDDAPLVGEKENTGFGKSDCFVRREHWQESGGFGEWAKWGGEDTIFWKWFRKRKLAIERRYPNFVHLWHPHPADQVAAAKKRLAQVEADIARGDRRPISLAKRRRLRGTVDYHRSVAGRPPLATVGAGNGQLG